MNNLEKYNEIFCRLFSVKPDQLDNRFLYQSVPAWDSIGHMEMVAELEDALGIAMEAEDILNFNSYNKGKELLRKYDIEI